MSKNADSETDLDTKCLHKISSLLNEFRKLDNEMPIQQALTFIWVALREADGVNIKDVADNLGISQASASRNVNAFMKINRYRRTGHDLIETHEDPMHRSRKLCNLTHKGTLVKKTLLEIIRLT